MLGNLFDANFYRANNADLASFNDTQALQHFQNFGLNEGRVFSPFVNLNFYRSSNADLVNFNNNQVFDHLQNFGVAEGRRFSPLVDLNFYRLGNVDLAGFNNEQIFEHLRGFGVNEGRRFSPLVDLNFYRASNIDLASFNNNQALYHLEIFGINEGRSFSHNFDVNYYRANNLDLISAGLNNSQLLEHFVISGQGEGRVSNDPGNTLATAYDFGMLTGVRSLHDFINSTDSNDYYRFDFSATGNLNVLLNGLNANADLQLLNSSGQVLQSSINSDTNAESLNITLNAGSYYIQVYPFSSATSTNYNLTVTADYAGNSRFAARNFGNLVGSRIFSDWVGSSDSSDYYSFDVSTTSDFKLVVDGLSADTDVQILDSNGAATQISQNFNPTPESIIRILDPGTYFIYVYPFESSTNTNYNLNLSVTPRIPGSFNIEFDYRFDSNQFFNDPTRRFVLESAARVWETIIRDEFTNVPIRTSLAIRNPQTNTGVILNSDSVIDDIVVFVGARNIEDNILADAGPSNSTLVDSSLNMRFNGSNFEPWTGSISFNNSVAWFFDSTPNTFSDIPLTSMDFLSVAVHEIGHVLGIGTSNAFNNLISGSVFNGLNSTALNQGNSIPLSSDLGHVQEGFLINGIGQAAALSPFVGNGTRKLPIPLDIALLRDIGYQI